MEPDSLERRMLGALLRIPFQIIVDRIYVGIQARGYTDVRPAHFVVFQLLPPEGARITDLADAAQITKQSMGKLVAHLEAQGYVAYTRDPSDRRAKRVQLTDRGQALDTEAREVLAEIETDWAELLGSKRLMELKQTLKDLIELIT